MSEHDCADWVYNFFETCDSKIISSRIIGYSSIAFWLFAQAPQIYENFKRGTAEGLSFLFLLCWLLGDCSNLIGSTLTKQNITQIATAVYFVSVDIILFSQYIFYSYIRKAKIGNENINGNENENGGMSLKLFSAYTGYLIGIGFIFAITNTNFDNENNSFSSGRLLQSFDDSSSNSSSGSGSGSGDSSSNSTEEIIGAVFSWISATLYVISRTPQIYKNFKRKSTEGLSRIMIIFAIMGNLTYATSVLLNPQGDYIPFLVGSLGTLCFDFTLFSQTIIFKPIDETNETNEIQETTKLINSD
eukprot:TRINITY_DN13_c0_g1_i1.p1 TRINITY_DN13_c0_g1~~TRINITY_DN13_c0_g1_i1.p1  ORF type:complete len:302 (+),score=88.42 TRINITY_DN13_c0_g1_i1:103-1008(+)